MAYFEFFAGINNSFFINFFAMLDDGIDKCARVSTGKNKAYFTNITVNNI